MMNCKALSRAVAAGSLVCGFAAAFAADGAPNATGTFTAQGSSSAISFLSYDSKVPVGVGQVDTNSLFFIKEKTGTYESQYVQSWYIFFDPSCVAVVDANITFSGGILGIDRTSKDLGLSTKAFGSNDTVYGMQRHTGLENRDSKNTYVLGTDASTLHIHWKAGDPGDHIRVYTVAHAPEPGTYALMLAGLGVLGAVARRRARSIPA
ncbi:MAG: PEP-CTERM sorting domain-containing protein [Burkholderiaceae bacterium]